MGWFGDRWDSLCDGYSNAGEIFGLAGDHFSNGNILGGLSQTVMGIGVGLGNTITIGYGTDWGNSLVDKTEEQEAAARRGEKIDNTNVFEDILLRMAREKADTEILQEHFEAEGDIGKANLVGGLALGSDALTLATGVNLTGAVTNSGKALLTKAFTKKMAGDLVTKSLVTTSVAQMGGNNLYNLGANVKEEGVAAAVSKELAGQTATVMDDTAELASDVGKTISNSFLAKYPGLGKFVNTCRAGLYATRNSIKSTVVGSYVDAVLEKAEDKVCAWAKGEDETFKNMSLKDVASQLRTYASEDSWSESYNKRVVELDANLGLDVSDRNLIGDDEAVLTSLGM